MRFAHMADLHIGKKLGPFDLIEDQKYALENALRIIEEAKVDAVFLAGDIYDRTVPSTEAVCLADAFLTNLCRIAPVFVVPGNHDSPERLAFGRQLLEPRGLVIAGAYDGQMEKYALFDEYGEICVSLLPFIRPRETEPYFENADFDSAEKAVSAVIERDPPKKGVRNIMVTHQFVTGGGESPILSDSEVNPVGGLSEVSSRVFDGYDYVALGHLHAAQKAGRECVRYAGSPLKYSFSETLHRKSLVIGEMDGEGRVKIELRPIPFLRDLRKIQGPADKLTDPVQIASENADDYVSITLTGDDIPASPMDALGAVYKNIAFLSLPERSREAAGGAKGAAEKSPMELFGDFYRLVTGGELTGEMAKIADEIMARAREEAGT